MFLCQATWSCEIDAGVIPVVYGLKPLRCASNWYVGQSTSVDEPEGVGEGVGVFTGVGADVGVFVGAVVGALLPVAVGVGLAPLGSADGLLLGVALPIGSGLSVEPGTGEVLPPPPPQPANATSRATRPIMPNE
jgi:hypothetical protein